MYHKKSGENFFVPASNAHECHSKEVIFFLLWDVFNYCNVYIVFHSDMQVLKSQLYVEKYVESNRRTFVDYISVGCQLNFMVGVDFTGMQ